MQSQFFSRFNLADYDDFKKGIAALFSLPVAGRTALLQRFHDYLGAFNDTDRSRVSREVAREAGVDEAEVIKAAAAIDTFVATFRDSDYRADTPEQLAADLLAQGVLPDAEIRPVEEFLRVVQTRARTDWTTVVQRRSEQVATIPALHALQLRVNYRPVFSEPYAVFTPADDYNPVCLGVEPVITVRLQLDKGSFKDISFQLTRRHAEAVIEQLRATIKLFDIAGEYLKLDSDQNSPAVDGQP